MMEDWQYALLAGTIIAALVGVALYYVYFYQPQDQAPPQLSVSLETLSGKALEVVPLSITISNNGDKASNVVVTLSSNAFGELITDSVDVSANGEESVSVDANIRDLRNQNYPVTISYTYDGMYDTPSETTEQFYIIPDLEITNADFLQEWGSPKSTIQQNGYTKILFKVKSNSESVTYYGLYACLDCLQVDQNLALTPLEMPIEVIGPQGKTDDYYEFRIDGNNTPVGQYTLELELYCDGYKIDMHPESLTVE